ncbi:MAG: hypothetical protein ACRED1_04860 [Limisphaerales bacterium]
MIEKPASETTWHEIEPAKRQNIKQFSRGIPRRGAVAHQTDPHREEEI